ncbi:MAG: hypothetical protein ABH864_01075 [archaeon]
MSDINVKETIIDKTSPFNIKRFNLRGLGSDFFTKTADITNVNKKYTEEVLGSKADRFIFEKGKEIPSFDKIMEIIKETDERKLNSFFDKKAWLNNKFTVLHSILKFNPYKHIKRLNQIDGFWYYYYSYSKDMVLIPNVLKERTPYDEEGKALSKETIINLLDYKKYVDETYEIFNAMNNKPLFVPLSIRFDIGEIGDLLEHYLKKEYFYIWIDFEGKPADPANSAVYAKVLKINTVLRNSKSFDKCILYVTNIKREITSNPKESFSPASNVLTSLCGANIVGKNKEPKRKFPPSEENKKKVIQHKARVFQEDTYYYHIIENSPISMIKNITENTDKLASEFDNQKQNFLKDFDIKNYLGSKKMIQEYAGGKILRSLNLKDRVKRNVV